MSETLQASDGLRCQTRSIQIQFSAYDLSIKRSPAWLAFLSLGFVKHEIFKTWCSGSGWIFHPIPGNLSFCILNQIWFWCCFHFYFHIKPQDVQFPDIVQANLLLFWAYYFIVLQTWITEILGQKNTLCTHQISLFIQA